MKRSTLEAMLRRKIRIQITKRKRGKFRLIFPFVLDEGTVYSELPTRKQALQLLAIRLRCMEPITIKIEGSPK